VEGGFQYNPLTPIAHRSNPVSILALHDIYDEGFQGSHVIEAAHTAALRPYCDRLTLGGVPIHLSEGPTMFNPFNCCRVFIGMAGWVIVAGLAVSAGLAAPPSHQKQHPWRPPFGLDAVGKSNQGGFEAAVELVSAERHNPLSAKTVFPKHGTLIAFPGDSFELRLAVANDDDQPAEMQFRATVHQVGTDRHQGLVQEALAIEPGKRQDFAWPLRMPAGFAPRATMHCEITDGTGAIRFAADTLIVNPTAQETWPEFGATACQLDYDLPISVRNPATGEFSQMPYSAGWPPSLQDVVVSLPGERYFVFWRGSSYVPFWARRDALGICYEWAEMLPPHPPGAVDCIEPLMDKELRYGRVRIMESTASRIHVQWQYQSCDLEYRIWGDEAIEDYYFYPDGFGTRVLTLRSAPDAEYELAELILLLPPDRYPLDAVPTPLVEALFLDGTKREINFPLDAATIAEKLTPGPTPALFRLRARSDDREAALFFPSTESRMPQVAFAPFSDGGQLVTPAYWGSHWPLARGNMTGGVIDDRIHLTPHHVSLLSWAGHRPPPVTQIQQDMKDTLGNVRPMMVRRWAWLIGTSTDTDASLLAWARSYAQPPAAVVRNRQDARIEWNSELRAFTVVLATNENTSPTEAGIGGSSKQAIEIDFTPRPVLMNPVIAFEGDAMALSAVLVNGQPTPAADYRWDGHILWLRGQWDAPITVTLR